MRGTGASLRLALVMMLLPLPVLAGGGVDLPGAPPGALSCSGCHAAGTGIETSVPAIHGRPVDEITAALAGFRAGTLPATVMNRIAPGFTADESRAIAVWLSRQSP